MEISSMDILCAVGAVALLVFTLACLACVPLGSASSRPSHTGYYVDPNTDLTGTQLEELKRRVRQLEQEKASERNVMYAIAGHWLGWW